MQEAVWQQNRTYRAENDCGGSCGTCRHQIWTQSEPDEVDDDDEEEVIED